MSDMENIRILELIIKSLENQISDEDFAELDAFVASSRENAHYFTTCVATYMGVRDYSEATAGNTCFEEVSFDNDLWTQLSEYERTAPSIEILKEVPQHELIHKVIHPKREKQKITKFQIFTFIVSAAAILFVIIFPKLFPPKPYSVDVATLVDQMNVKWSDSLSEMENGSRLWTNEAPFILEKGIVSILYDNGVKLVIESPAKFELEQSGILLKYGRLFSDVSESGLGFSVETPTCKFVDLGTEFGVQSDINGSAELHVIKGKVQLFAGAERSGKSSQTIQENTAVRFDINTEKTRNIPIQRTAFVRRMSSKSNLLWRGQPVIDLVDIVCGGNGLGIGRRNIAIDLVNGAFIAEEAIKGTNRSGMPGYLFVEDSAYIDGVFVPDGGQGPVIVSSENMLFFDCPDTSGAYWCEITNARAKRGKILKYLAVLDGIQYGSKENPALMLHANGGITFDLESIRRDLPNMDIVSFSAKCGVSQDLQGEERDGGAYWAASSHFWVLVDGQVQDSFACQNLKSGAHQIDIPLNESDRFLTLITTDGGDDLNNGGDWCIFGIPSLLLKQTD